MKSAVFTATCEAVASDPPTYSKDVAPIIIANCSECHRPGQSAPFSLLTYDDVRKRGKQIAYVTQSRFMPPWLPEPAADGIALQGERRLNETEIDTIRRWVESGMHEGEAVVPHEPPSFSEGWRLGEPDIVLKMNEAYLLPASTSDTIRTFVLPFSTPLMRVFSAIDVRVTDPRVVHHASFSVDTTGMAKLLDADDAAPGYPGMGDLGLNQAGSLGMWSPNAPVQRLPPGIGRAIPKECDFIVEMHFNPSGKQETVQAQIGLYLARGSVTHRAVSVSLGASYLNIAAGEKNFVVRDAMTMPVDSVLYDMTPHAHYICTRVRAWATFPEGSSQQLLLITDWNFNFQQTFRLREPLALPKGSRLQIEMTYDNSESNSRNPHDPPQRVRSGSTALDEMAVVFFTLTAAKNHERGELERAHEEKLRERQGEALRQREQSP